MSRAAGADGAAANGASPSVPARAISADGGTALFGSEASNLGDGDVSRFRSVHARTLSGRQDLDLVSLPTGADPAEPSGTNDSSFEQALSAVSADGRYVAF